MNIFLYLYLYIMNINNNYYKKKIINSINKIYKNQGKSGSIVYKTKDNKILKKMLSIKNYEYNFLENNLKIMNNSIINVFIVDYIKYFKYKKNNYFLMRKYNYNINDIYTQEIIFNNNNKIFIQLMFTIYYLNNYLNIYHNDLVSNIKVETINYMIEKNNKKNNFIYYKNLKIDYNEYNIKIIDFGYADNKIIFKNLRTYNMYFKKNIFISEIYNFCFIYINRYFINVFNLLNKEMDENDIKQKIQKYFIKLDRNIISILKKNNMLNKKNYDFLILNFFYNLNLNRLFNNLIFNI